LRIEVFVADNFWRLVLIGEKKLIAILEVGFYHFESEEFEITLKGMCVGGVYLNPKQRKSLSS
jgi:hypothetical protein